MKLIVGLGNPGPEYAASRHNMGFMCVNKLARAYKISLNQKHSRSLSGKGMISDYEVVLAKPRTYMNNSGVAVRLLMQNYRAALSDLLIIYDDMDLPLGKLRLKPEGSAGGHHGMESIIRELGKSSFARIRVGIGRQEELQGAHYVLSSFLPEENEIIKQTLERVVELFPLLLKEAPAKAMNEFNR